MQWFKLNSTQVYDLGLEPTFRKMVNLEGFQFRAIKSLNIRFVSAEKINFNFHVQSAIKSLKPTK